MFGGSRVVLEKKTQFSKSILWALQRDYFSKQGVNAWVNQVPYYITSNPFIANAYAQVAFRFIEDHVRSNNYSPEQPFYITELGTGCGKFSYYVMRRLFELQESLGLAEIKICYVMTDFTNSNLAYWEKHPALKEYRDAGKLDFAIYDLENSDTIELVNSKVLLKAGYLKNPLLVFGNYIFDTVCHDVFHIEKGKLQEALVRTSTTRDNIKNKMPVDMEKLETSFDHQTINENYYEDKHLNAVLKRYSESLDNTTFLIPTGGIHAINTLRKISNDNLLLISTDKGYSHLYELEYLNDPSVVFHGSFSMMVNFDAMFQYIKNIGGDYHQQSSRRGITTGVFLVGNQLANLPGTQNAVKTYIEQFSPADFFNMHEHMKKSREDVELRILLAHMNLCHWDPHIFRIFASRLLESITQEDNLVLEGFAEGMAKIADNFYYMPSSQDTLFEIATFFQTIKRYDQALTYYQRSLDLFPAAFPTFYNMGMCAYFMDNFTQAMKLFEQAKQINPSSEEAQSWINRIREEQG